MACSHIIFSRGAIPGSTPRQIVLTLDPAGAWRKDRIFFANHKTFFKRKRGYP